MQIIDIILIVPFLWFGLKGLINGLLKELFSTLALLLGLYAAIHFSSYVGNFLAGLLSSTSPYFKLGCFAITFIGALLGMKLGTWIVERFFSKVGIGWLNKLGGLVLGLLKGVFIVGSITYLLNNFDKNNAIIDQDTKNKSLLYYPISNFVIIAYPSLHHLILEVSNNNEKE
ncbi:MAG: CvpA family protein [Bacteroidales bacterium]